MRRRSAIFQIHALAGKQHYTVSSSTQDSAAGGDGEGSGGGNLTSQTISTETDYDPWPEIEGQLKGLLDPGTRLSVAPSSASVTVSGTPRDIARARAYLGYLNREVLRPVTLSVHVYSVRVEREADYDLGLSFSIARLLGDLSRRPDAWVRNEMGVSGLRTVRELRGDDCIGFENMAQPKRTTMVSRCEPPVDMMDKPLRALPTSPRAQQQQQEDRFKGILAA